jgi:stage V sporulation protein G
MSSVITDVKVELAKDTPEVKAYASIVSDESFRMRGLKIIAKDKGGFLVETPSRKLRNGNFQNMALPLDANTRTLAEKAVISEYDDELKKRQHDVRESQNRSCGCFQ